MENQLISIWDIIDSGLWNSGSLKLWTRGRKETGSDEAASDAQFQLLGISSSVPRGKLQIVSTYVNILWLHSRRLGLVWNVEDWASGLKVNTVTYAKYIAA